MAGYMYDILVSLLWHRNGFDGSDQQIWIATRRGTGTEK